MMDCRSTRTSIKDELTKVAERISTRRLLAVFAHPDDESFLSGGTLARYASEGAEVHLLVATRGEAGRHGRSRYPSDEQLGAARAKEMVAAAEALGLAGVWQHDFGDKKLSRQQNRPKILKAIADAILELQPQVILTFGPDGIYGHPDHVAIGEITEEAFLQSGALMNGSAPCKLYHLTSRREATGQRTLPLDEVNAREGVLYPQDVFCAVEISRYLEQKARAIFCHETQTGGWFGGIFGRLSLRPTYEVHRLAMTRILEFQRPEEDLFAGI